MSKAYWDKTYQTLAVAVAEDEPYQPWIDAAVLADVQVEAAPGQALDLGCGLGLDSRFLRDFGFEVTSLDQSAEALARGQQLGWIKQGVQAELGQLPIPLFEPAQFDLIVASLSLHYFPAPQIEAIMATVMRWLKPSGIFYSRFNSIEDKNFGAANASDDGVWLCPEQGMKVFYTPARLRALLQPYGEPLINRKTIHPYGKPKQVLECWLQKHES